MGNKCGTKVNFKHKNGTRKRNRTSDQKFRKPLLYPLSYPGASFLFETVS